MKSRRRTFSPAVYRAILKRQGNVCACGCKEKLESMADIQFDHETPLHLGGADEPDNLRALKKRHHIAKSTRELKARAKTARIQAQNGLLKKKPSARHKIMARSLGMEP